MKFFTFISKIKTYLQLKFSKKPYVVVALGDSTVEGLGASHPDKAFASIVFEAIRPQKKPAEFHNLGKAGAKIIDVLNFQLKKAVSLKPDLVIISIGTNDIINPAKTFQFAKNYEAMVKTLAQQTSALIVVNNIPDFSITPRIPRAILPWFNFLAKRLNREINKYAQEVSAVLIDLYSHSKEFKANKELISADGFHPSDLGYALWGNIILAAISPVIK